MTVSSHQPSSPPARPPLYITLIATFFGSGFSPIWPGTAGTLATVPLAYVLMRLGLVWLVAVAVALFFLGTWAADRYCAATATHDSGHIVIDEVVGYLLSLVLVPLSGANLIVGFALFRLFDIWKPWPIRLVDRHVGGGFGVMADDVCAGIVSAGCLYFLQAPIQSALSRLGLEILR